MNCLQIPLGSRSTLGLEAALAVGFGVSAGNGQVAAVFTGFPFPGQGARLR